MSAGHLPPVLVEPAQAPRVLWEGRSLPLGVAPNMLRRHEGGVTLVPGARLIFYTDGLVERSGESIDVGLDRLLATVDASRELPPEPLTHRLAETLTGEQPDSDDVCAVCLEFVGASS
jgi:serine phosphatase RsbU (regulator of sigma subunit)